MTPAQFKAARAKLRLSVTQLAHILGVSRRTITGWQSGETAVSPTAARVVTWMLQGYRPPEWPERPQYSDPRPHL